MTPIPLPLRRHPNHSLLPRGPPNRADLLRPKHILMLEQEKRYPTTLRHAHQHLEPLIRIRVLERNSRELRWMFKRLMAFLIFGERS